MASSLLQLDLDTTTVILTLIEPVDALRLALTCRAAQKVAIPRLLSEVDIGPDWQKNGRDRVGKFSRYMLQRPAERIPHLKTLVINSETFVTGAADPRTGEMYVDFNFTAAVTLAAVVQRALRLRKLSIGGAEFLFEGVPELAAAVASLTNIQELSFTHTGIGVARVLSRMRSRPRDVECSILEMRDKQEAKRYTNFRQGRDRFLHNFTECLEKVRLDGILLDLSQDILSLLEGDTVWPRVHDLTINDSVVDDLNFFARAFPNVRRLHLNAVSVNEPVINSAAWTSLDFLALHWPRCPVCHRIRWLRFNFTLTSGRHYRNAMRYAESEDLLRATKPAILDAFGTPELFKCVAEANSALKFLRVYVAPTATGSPSGQVDSLDSWLENVTPHMKKITLRGLAIVTQCQVLEQRGEYAQKILASHPTLEYVGFARWTVSAVPPSWADDSEPYTWYHAAARPENGPPVVEMLRVGAANVAYQSLLDTPASQ